MHKEQFKILIKRLVDNTKFIDHDYTPGTYKFELIFKLGEDFEVLDHKIDLRQAIVPLNDGDAPNYDIQE